MLSLVVPVYRNEESIPELLDAVDTISDGTPDGFEVVFVVDGSPDDSYEVLHRELPKRRFRSQLVRLSRNFGSLAAVRAGLEVGHGERFAIMAADLQEPPGLPLQMDEVLRNGEADVVFGVREERDDPVLSRYAANAYWGTYRRLIIKDLPPGGVDLFACTRAVRDELLRMKERSTSLIGQLAWVGFRRAYIPYTRAARPYGKSAWTFSKKLTYFLDSIFAFTDLPIRLLVVVGGLVAVISGLYGLVVLLGRIFGAVEVPGFTALILLVIFFGALNLFALGIVGSYAARAYENTKARPHHVVQSEVVFDAPPGDASKGPA